ncbi:Wzz/FepE/Etk N-terminal domain-containing protein [Staphylococcus sp. IVB6181]|nr:Wzz/FepE/Etk N-terminal domain-containing protein [Staphylococcus sp. IVB6181]
MKKKLDLVNLLVILKKYIKLLIILPLCFLVLGLFISFFLIQPKYATTTQILVNQKKSNNEMMAQQVQSNIHLVKTYGEIIKSPRILDKVSKELQGKYSSKVISQMLTVNNQAESQIINITVTSKSEKDAVTVANEITNVFSRDASKIMNIDNVSVLSKAVDAKKVSPRPLVNGGICFCLGIISAFFIIVLKLLFDKRIKNENDVEEVLNLPVLGSITELSKKK